MTAVEWAPKNGERVWIKVFSNWSLGTYIGFDTTENTHLVREDVSGGGSLMSSSQVLPESAYPNISKQPTAVEWFVQQLRNGKELNDNLIQQAKAMEKEQMIKFAKNCLQENDCFFDIEKYYNETFKSE